MNYIILGSLFLFINLVCKQNDKGGDKDLV